MLYNRDLSWLTFNHRVLQEAADRRVPLYERLKFLAIFSSNLDEFFRVRYPAVAAFSKLDKKTLKKQSLLSKEDIAEKIQATTSDQLNEFGYILIHDLIPGLKAHGIHFYYNQPLLSAHWEEAKELFLSSILSFIQPVIIGSGVAYNFLPENNRLYFVVTVKEEQAEMISHIVVNIPSDKIDRLMTLKPLDGQHYVILMDDIIRAHMGFIFPGKKILSIFSIKFNRDADVEIGDDYTDKLLDKIEKQLSKRDVGAASRFLYEKGMPLNLQVFLASMFNVNDSDMFEGGRYHNLSDLMNFPVFDASLLSPKRPAVTYNSEGNIFDCISRKDVLLHFPYHSYSPVLSFFNRAAVDAEVTEIYITLYRVAKESHIVNALISAAKNGKKVTAFIELKARFDEANNIKWSRVMKQAGVRLIYSKSSVKVHSKIALIKKKHKDVTSSYAILSTGNFNENTASFYTDHLVMTTRKNVCEELELLFDFLQDKNNSIDKPNIKFRELFVSQFNLIGAFEALVNIEIEKAAKGQPALLRIKVNNLEEPYMINLLYKAAKAGVVVKLIIRSICCIMPSEEGVNGNILVKRIVDKYLEHTRLFIFGADDDEAVVAMGSSDLMTRNLRRRIEVCLHVKDAPCKKQLTDYFNMQWRDNTKATRLLPNMEWERIATEGAAHNAQDELYDYIKQLPA